LLLLLLEEEEEDSDDNDSDFGVKKDAIKSKGDVEVAAAAEEEEEVDAVVSVAKRLVVYDVFVILLGENEKAVAIRRDASSIMLSRERILTAVLACSLMAQ